MPAIIKSAKLPVMLRVTFELNAMKNFFNYLANGFLYQQIQNVQVK